MNTSAPSSTQSHSSPISTRPGILFFGLTWWEVMALLVSVVLIAFIALPNYFTALETLRGKECSRRLLLVANCLKALAQQNGTKPGEKICEPLDLNYALDVAQGAMSIKGDFTYIPAFFRFGTEPDCPGIGDHVYNLNLDENGNIIPPRCTRIDGPRGEYFREHNLHVCDMSKVDGKITSSQIQSATP